jgi:hypothetical protein
MSDLQRIRLWVPLPQDGELLTINTARGRIHWRKWAALTKAWRDQTACEARAADVRLELAPGQRVVIEGLPVQGKGGTLADPGGHMPTLKACVDGLRDAGWLHDDSGTYVAAITMFPPIRATDLRAPGMAIDLTTVPAVVAQLF